MDQEKPKNTRKTTRIKGANVTVANVCISLKLSHIAFFRMYIKDKPGTKLSSLVNDFIEHGINWYKKENGIIEIPKPNIELETQEMRKC